jgi:peptidyl-prolyl cis-trans isomerase SurA
MSTLVLDRVFKMRPKRFAAICALIFITASLSAHAGDVVDRIVATVNGQIILQSDWEDEVRYEAFVAKKPLGSSSSPDRKAALDHLIDQELLREQMHAPESVPPTEQEVQNQIQEIRKQYEGGGTEEAWTSLLAAHRLDQGELRRRLALQIQLARLVDIRLRPAANISPKSIESYYNQELLPQLRHSGAKEVPLAEVSPQIKELLTQQKINQLLTTWLRDLHAGSEIHTQLYSAGDEARRNE